MRTTRSEPELALIVGAARSGTTLLRSLLDAHPEIGCPAEAGLPALIGHARRVWATVCASDDPTPADPLGIGSPDAAQVVVPLPEDAEREIRRSATAMMTYYCQRDRKRIYCDKSLDTGPYLPAVFHSFPNAKCIIIVRHVMDTIASGLEATPWGFNAFGYTPFVHASPDNTVMALARYWEMHVSTALKWQESHPVACHCIRYEDLVADPPSALSTLFEFLDVENDMSVLVRGFTKHNPLSGPGDYKLAFTRAINSESVGRGKQVPVTMIPPSLLARLNELLESLAYPSLTASWNAEPKPFKFAADSTRRELEHIMSFMRDGDWRFDVESIAILADDDLDLRWVVEPGTSTVSRGDGEVDVVITGTAEDLVQLMSGAENLGVLMRSGRIRCVYADTDQPRFDLPGMMASLVACFRAPSARGTPDDAEGVQSHA